MFCPECGTDHHVADRAAEAAADREVTLAKISAERDVKIAQIEAGVRRDTAEAENALETARAEGIAEGMTTVVETGAVVDGQAPEPGAGDPIVVEAPEAEAEPEADPEMMPPVVETPAPHSGKSASGWWAGYR